MDAQLAQSKFQQADTLFKQGRHQEAFRVLTELNNAFPNSKNILYPMALCLDKLGQRAEAERLCSILVQKFQDTRAETLMAQLQAAATPNLYEVPGVDALQFNISGEMPSAFGPQPRAAMPPAESKRGVLIGAAAVVAVLAIAAVGAAGAKQGWFASGPTKFEQLEKQFTEIMAPATSMSATVQIAAKLPQAPFPITGSGTIDYMQTDGRLYLRAEGGSTAPPASLILAANGESLFLQIDAMGEKMIIKLPVTPEMTTQVNPAAAFSQLRGSFDVKSLPDEVLGGKDVWTFDLKPKAEVAASGPTPIPMGNVARIKLWVEGESLSCIKTEAFNTEGESMFSYTLTNIRLDVPLAPEKFAYTPPEGVQVMDMSAMGAMGGGMMPFMGQ